MKRLALEEAPTPFTDVSPNIPTSRMGDPDIEMEEPDCCASSSQSSDVLPPPSFMPVDYKPIVMRLPPHLAAQLATEPPVSTPFEHERKPASPSPTPIVPVDVHPLTAPNDPPLTEQQAEILERILNGENIFFTGSAGTGKSVLLRAIIRAFKERYDAEMAEDVKHKKANGETSSSGEAYGVDEVKERRWKLAVTASTGMAAM
jgi:Cdc6-like AAA superfamily ATPase